MNTYTITRTFPDGTTQKYVAFEIDELTHDPLVTGLERFAGPAWRVLHQDIAEERLGFNDASRRLNEAFAKVYLSEGVA